MLNIKVNIEKEKFFEVVMGQSGKEMIEDLTRRSVLKKAVCKDENGTMKLRV